MKEVFEISLQIKQISTKFEMIQLQLVSAIDNEFQLESFKTVSVMNATDAHSRV